MTIEDMLTRGFGGYHVSMDGPEHASYVANEEVLCFLRERPLIRAISSHQIHYPIPEAPGFLFYDLCFVRDPIDRIRSMYDYFRRRQFPGEPVSDIANRTSLGEFIAELIDEIPWYVNNPQTNLLANGIANDVPQQGDLDRAIETMLRVSFLGVVDCFEESIAAGQLRLRSVFPELRHQPETVNVSGGLTGSLEQRITQLRNACRPSVFKELLRLNALDLQLVELARAEIKRRYTPTKSHANVALA